ncbi:hypothetical protein [Catalinimonas niigatensis]|uniref:hypothetical protein n=1 Tax=Catalinimonas niigatensis TaxID=1397264 RepID=UPI0026667A19|nr:hypothetical protein [Catalinimonas niigatensis]WPP49980.1 hypothetical protein PZB72_25280 [Catalinimonas niigatensis]
MNWKVIISFFAIWILFLSVLLFVGKSEQEMMEERYQDLLESQLAQRPEVQAIESSEKAGLPVGLPSGLEIQTQLQMIRKMLTQLSTFNGRMHNIMRNPAPIYPEEIALEKLKYQEDIQDLRQKVSLLLGQSEALGTSIPAMEDEYSQ